MLKDKGFRLWKVCLPALLKQGVLVWHSKLLEYKCHLEIWDTLLLAVIDATIMNVWQVLTENHPTSSKKVIINTVLKQFMEQQLCISREQALFHIIPSNLWTYTLTLETCKVSF